MLHSMKMLAVPAVAIMILTACEPPTHAITPPIPGIVPEKIAYQIDPIKDTILVYKTGSVLHLPASAFVDAQGNVIQKPVQVTYMEMPHVLDAYLAGVPMAYDSGGREMVFETAGMFEMRGYCDGVPVYPNPDKNITVDLISLNGGSGFNNYILDEMDNTWKYLGKNTSKEEAFADIQDSLPVVPPPPVVAGLYSFSVGDATGNHPELSMYENVLFQPVNNKQFGTDGTDIRITDAGNGVYNVTFIINAFGIYHERTCPCYLAFRKGVDYDNALKKYQQKYASLLKKREDLQYKLEAP